MKHNESNKMRIVCLTHYYIEENRAGGELMVHAILKSLVDAGHDVTALITSTTRLNNIVDGVKVIYGCDRARVLDTYDYDLLISQFDNTDIALENAHKRNKPVMLVVHNDMPFTKNSVSKLNENDFVVYNTEWIKNQFKTPCKSMVVHPPIVINKPKVQVERKYVTLVNVTKEKGAMLFYALARSMPNVTFLAVKGGYWKDRQVVLSQPNVLVIENTPDMCNDVYAKSKIVIMPSSYESYGMVAAEAISYGIPVISSPLDGLKENLGDAGIYIPLTDIPAWVDNIRQLFSNDDYYNAQSKKCLEVSATKDSKKELAEMVAQIEEMVKL